MSNIKFCFFYFRNLLPLSSLFFSLDILAVFYFFLVALGAPFSTLSNALNLDFFYSLYPLLYAKKSLLPLNFLPLPLKLSNAQNNNWERGSPPVGFQGVMSYVFTLSHMGGNMCTFWAEWTYPFG
jgi:hypothetical protein